MNPFLTRRQLLERAALGGAALSVPGLLAACGGSGGIEGSATTTGTAGGTTAAKELADKLTMSNWTLYIDIDEETNERPTLVQFTEKTGVEVDYIEDVNDNDEWFGKNQAALKAGNSIGRDITVLTDWMAGRMVRLGYVEKLDRDAIPNASNLVSALASPGWDPNREYSPSVAVRPHRDRLRPGALRRRDHLGAAAARGSEAEGEGLLPHRDARHDGHAAPARRVRPGEGRHGRVREVDCATSEGGRLGSDPPVHGERLRAAARPGGHLGLRCLVGRHGAAEAREPEARVRHPGRRRDDLHGQHADPEGRRRLHRVDVHELRLRPEGRGADRGLRQLHLPGRGCRTRRSARSTRRSPTTR